MLPDEILTQRLTLRRPRPEDAPAIAAATGDREVSRWLTQAPHPYTRAAAEAFIARCLAKDASSARLIEAGGEVVGCIGIEREFGYWLARGAWGRGYATEAGRAMLGAYFRAPKAAPLGSSHFEGNARSARVLQKLGFGYLAEPPWAVVPKSTGTEVLCHGLALTPEQWHALNPWVIETARLTLRPLRPSDAAELARIGGDARVAPMILSATSPWPEPQVRDWIARSRFRGPLGFSMAIQSGGAVIGVVGGGARAPGRPQRDVFPGPGLLGAGDCDRGHGRFH